jgi:uncharacterized protein YjbJ (UPF0337 family)
MVCLLCVTQPPHEEWFRLRNRPRKKSRSVVSRVADERETRNPAGTLAFLTYGDQLNRNRKEGLMDWNRIEGNWKQFKGRAKENWGRLTDNDLDVINGRQDQLEGKIQERYGLAKDQAKKDVEAWFKSLP